MFSPVDSRPANHQHLDAGANLLSGIAGVRQRFVDASRAVTSRAGVLASRSEFDCRAYDNGTTLELYLEVDVQGRTVCWWLDATQADGCWDITASVLANRNDREYQDQLLDMPRRIAATGELLPVKLDAAAKALLATMEQDEFLAPAV